VAAARAISRVAPIWIITRCDKISCEACASPTLPLLTSLNPACAFFMDVFQDSNPAPAMRLTKATSHAIRILIACAQAGDRLVKVAEVSARG
jgi:hypothetical protein